MLPATKVVPKELLPILDKPLIQYAIDEAVASGFDQLIFVVGSRSTLLKEYLTEDEELVSMLREQHKTDFIERLESIVPKGVEVSFVTQTEPLGLGHAVWCARTHINDNESFAVMLPDDLLISPQPCLQQMLEAYDPQSMDAIIGAVEIEDKSIEKYGVFETERTSGRSIFAKGIVEKPPFKQAPSTHAAIGRYILPARVLRTLDVQSKGAGGEIQLTDAIAKLIQGVRLCGYLFEGKRFDCGSKQGLLLANLEVASESQEFQDILETIARLYTAA